MTGESLKDFPEDVGKHFDVSGVVDKVFKELSTEEVTKLSRKFDQAFKVANKRVRLANISVLVLNSLQGVVKAIV